MTRLTVESASDKVRVENRRSVARKKHNMVFIEGKGKIMLLSPVTECIVVRLNFIYY